MADPVWGQLVKSQVDAETIEEAIDRIVASHNDDSESHLGSGQSLQSHKAAEIIDHLAESIVADKIKKRAVNFSKIDFDRFVYVSSLESLDAWFQTNTGGRGSISLDGPSVLLASGNQSGDIASIALVNGLNVGNDLNPYFVVAVLAPELPNENADMWVMCSVADPDGGLEYGFGFWFKQSTGILYAVWGNGSSYSSQDTGITSFAGVLELKAEYDPNSDVLNFYVNNTLVYSVASPDLTTGNDTLLVIGQKSKTAAAPTEIRIFNPVFSMLYN